MTFSSWDRGTGNLEKGVTLVLLEVIFPDLSKTQTSVFHSILHSFFFYYEKLRLVSIQNRVIGIHIATIQIEQVLTLAPIWIFLNIQIEFKLMSMYC